MKSIKYSLVILLLISINSYGQLNQLPLPELIKRIKPSIIAIEARDDTILTIQNEDTTRFQSFASGVLLGFSKENVYAVTNEHVISIKDTIGNTIRYAKEIYVSINVKSFGAISFPAKIRKADEDLDLVALRIFIPRAISDSLDAISISQSLWEEEENLHEGEFVLYSGYPLMLGRGKENYPLTRWGMISQLIPGDSTFMIDAFVQPGYSGSPVFLIRSVGNTIPTKWEFKFVGITSSYPYRFMPIYRKVQYLKIQNVVTQENPGFSNVIGISAIKKLFDIK